MPQEVDGRRELEEGSNLPSANSKLRLSHHRQAQRPSKAALWQRDLASWHAAALYTTDR